MTPFCHNPLCRHKDEAPDNLFKTDILEDNKLFILTRHKWGNGDGAFFLCGICHNAIQIVGGPPTEPITDALQEQTA